MLDLKVGLFSRSVLGAMNNPSTISRKISILVRLNLLDSRTRSFELNTADEVLAVFRVANFNAADLVICSDMVLEQVVSYRNPCNLRHALKAAICVCESASLPDVADDLRQRLNSHFSGSSVPRGPDSTSSAQASSVFRGLLDSLDLSDGVHGCSLFATQPFAHGDAVLRLDKDVPISVLSAFRDSRFPGADLFEQGLHPDTIFLLFLICLRDRASGLENQVHAEFFASQPKSYGTLFELPERIRLLFDETELSKSVEEQNGELRNICASLQPSPDFADLLWAKCLCTSRAFSLRIQPESDIEKRVIASYYPSGLITTILPVVHFLNHDFSAQLETPVVTDDGCIAVKALVDIQPGSELFLLYGGFTNKELVLNYGFLIPKNPYDSYTTSDGRLLRRGALDTESDAADVNNLTLPEVEEEYKDLVHGYLRDRAGFLAACSRTLS